MCTNSVTKLEVEPMIHNGYDVIKKPVHGFMVHYGQYRCLMFRVTREAALQDGEAYVRDTGRWVD